MAINKERFKQAIRAAISSEYENILDNEDIINYTFSERFMKRMNKLIKAQRKPYYFLVNTALKRVAVAIIAVSIMFSASMSVKAVREPVIEFIVEIYERFTKYFICDNAVYNPSKVYELTNLPDGYEMESRVNNEAVITTTYINKSGNKIVLQQHLITSGTFIYDINKYNFKSIQLKNVSVDIYYNTELSSAIWIIDNDSVLKLIVYNDIILDDLIELIINIS